MSKKIVYFFTVNKKILVWGPLQNANFEKSFFIGSLHHITKLYWTNFILIASVANINKSVRQDKLFSTIYLDNLLVKSN